MTVNTPLPAGPPTDRILRAILSTIVAMACFSILNAMSKTLSTSGYPVIEVIWARYVFAFVFMLAMFLPRSGMKLFSIRRLDTTRSTAELAALATVAGDALQDAGMVYAAGTFVQLAWKPIASSPSIRSLSTSQLGRFTRSSLRTGRPPMIVVSRL